MNPLLKAICCRHIGDMGKCDTGTRIEEREKCWRARMREQEASTLTVKQFCTEQGLSQRTFYVWKKRVQKERPMRFALVETEGAHEPGSETGLELVLARGERLRIGAGVDVTRLRQVLEALRA